MKNRIFTVLFALTFVFSCFAFYACGEDEEIITDVKFSSYDNGDGDMISFYMTSDTEAYGNWDYTIEGDNVSVFFESEELKNYGSFGSKGTASYKTLILKPVSEGEATVSFELSEGEAKYSFSVKTEKDDSGSLRIEAEEITE